MPFGEQETLYTFCTKTLLLRLFDDFNDFRINKFRDLKNLSSSWFESMPGSHTAKPLVTLCFP
jgi:hypothetical protein